MTIYLLLLLIFILCLYFLLAKKSIDNISNVKKYDIIISTNCHEKLNFLIKQLENINKFVKVNYLVILNP